MVSRSAIPLLSRRFPEAICAALDPNDDTTLWTLQPYAEARAGGLDADSRWGTWWGRLGDCEIRPVITLQPVGDSGCIGDMFSFTVAEDAP